MSQSSPITPSSPLPPPLEVAEPWDVEASRLANLKGSEGGKNYSHVGGVNSSFEGHLFGACDPHGGYRQRVIMHEKPVHRTMQVMMAKGYTIEEIAQFTGYTRQRVADILRQPWAQLNVVEDIKKSVQDEIKELLEAEVVPSIRRVMDLRDDTTAPHAVRLAANKEILDRFLGRAAQPILNQSVEPTKLSNKELEQRVSQIVAGVATETGNTP